MNDNQKQAKAFSIYLFISFSKLLLSERFSCHSSCWHGICVFHVIQIQCLVFQKEKQQMGMKETTNVEGNDETPASFMDN